MSLEQVIQEYRDCSKTELDRVREENESLQNTIRDLGVELSTKDHQIDHLQTLIRGLSNRVAIQAELLRKRAEKS